MVPTLAINIIAASTARKYLPKETVPPTQQNSTEEQRMIPRIYFLDAWLRLGNIFKRWRRSE
jgi:hypothetical protein